MTSPDMLTNAQKTNVHQFDENWRNAIDTSEYATVQISPRKVMVIFKPETRDRSIQYHTSKGGVQSPPVYVEIGTVRYSFLAVDVIMRHLKERGKITS